MRSRGSVTYSRNIADTTKIREFLKNAEAEEKKEKAKH